MSLRNTRVLLRYATPLNKMVKIVEVGPRDGLQNENLTIVPTTTKVELISRLFKAGLRDIEATAFVSAKRVPQMADAKQVLAALPRCLPTNSFYGLKVSVLTPNLRGLNKMLLQNEISDEVAIFTAASESFNKANLGCSIDESLQEFRLVVAKAVERKIPVRGYVSCVLGCPFEGDISPSRVSEITRKLLELGCYEVSLGDTIGIGTPSSIAELLTFLLSKGGGNIPVTQLAVHCHDTYGRGLANISEALRFGVRVVDSSVAGLGGCPFAPGATGNVATEDVVHMLHASGYETGINMNELSLTGEWITKYILKRNYGSRAGNAFLASLRKQKL